MHRCPECLNHPGDIEKCPLCEGVGEFETISGDVWQRWVMGKRIDRDPEIGKYIGKCFTCGEEYPKTPLPPLNFDIFGGASNRDRFVGGFMAWYARVEELKAKYPDRNYGFDTPPHKAPCGNDCMGGMTPQESRKHFDEQSNKVHSQGACGVCYPVFPWHFARQN